MMRVSTLKTVRKLAGRRAAAAVGLLALPLLGGCNIRAVLNWDMYDQPKVSKPYRPSDFFEDKQSARPLVEGTVPRREVVVDRSSVGVDYEQAQYLGDAFPAGTFGEGNAVEPETAKKVLERGQVVFNVYCAVCHGQTGKGDGMVVQRGFIRPPSFVLPADGKPAANMTLDDMHRWERTQFLQTAPPRHVYNAISQGFGAMYSYGERVKPADRWAVAAYVKALQATPVEAVPTAPGASPDHVGGIGGAAR